MMNTYSSKSPTPSSIMSKSNLIQWLRNTLSDIPSSLKIEDLGTGAIYCRLINNYYSNIIPSNRILYNPKNEYQRTTNLKLLQNAFAQMKIGIPIDVGKIAKMKFQENWALLNSLYKHFNNNSDLEVSVGNDDSRSVQGYTPMSYNQAKTPKRTFEQAFMMDSQFYQKQHKETIKESFAPKQIHRENSLKGSRVQEQSISNTTIPPPLAPNMSHFYLQPSYSLPQFYYPPSIFNTISPKHSTGKLYKENSFIPNSSPYQQPSIPSISQSTHRISSPMKGKWSVSSQFFQSNHHAIIDRVKEILLKSSNDTEKIRQVKMLLNIPIEEDIIKIEEEDLPANNPGIQKIQFRDPKQKQRVSTCKDENKYNATE